MSELELAELMGLTPKQAIALPSVLEVSAKHLKINKNTLIYKCKFNVRLRNYLKELCDQIN